MAMGHYRSFREDIGPTSSLIRFTAKARFLLLGSVPKGSSKNASTQQLENVTIFPIVRVG